MIKPSNSKPSLSLKTKLWITIGTLLAFFVVFYVTNYFRQKDAAQLKLDGFSTIAVVEKLEDDVMGGKSQKRDLISFYFIKNDTVVHDEVYLSWVGIHHYSISIGSCFNMRASASDYSNFKVNFEHHIVCPPIKDLEQLVHIYN